MKLWTRIGVTIGLVVLVSLAGGWVYSLTGESEDGGLPGFALVKPLFAQEDPAAFPDPDVGLSAYVKFEPGQVDLDLLIENLLLGLKVVGDNYVMGWISQHRFGSTIHSWPTVQDALS